MKRLFVRVDILNDFYSRDGLLYVNGIESIYPVTKKISELIDSEDCLVAYVNDCHKPEDKEFIENGGNFPKHALEGSKGSEIFEIAKVKKDSFIFNKRTYDVFDSKLGDKEFKKFLKEKEITEVWVDGCVTEICIDATIKGIRKHFPNIKVYVFENGIMHLSEENKKTTISEWKKLGVCIAKCGL